MEYLCFLVKLIYFDRCLMFVSCQFHFNILGILLFSIRAHSIAGYPQSTIVTGVHLYWSSRYDPRTSKFAFSLTSYVTTTGHALEGYIRERDRGSGCSLSYDSRHGHCSFVYLVNKSFNLLTRLS